MSDAEKGGIPADELIAGDDVETYIGPFAGYKRLKFIRVGEKKIISPYRVRVEWWPKSNIRRAACLPVDGTTSHDAPAYNCGCGYYAFWDFSGAFNALIGAATLQTFTFVALVLGSGETVLHDRGFRSEYMELAAIHGNSEAYRAGQYLDLESVGDELGVPLMPYKELTEYAHQVGVVAPNL